MSNIDRNEVWRLENSVMARIVEGGMQAYAESLPNIDKAFGLQDMILRCMDGRTPGGVHLAGSGILLGLGGAVKFAEEVKRLCGKKVEEIGWHKDCGAAAAYAKEYGGTADDNARQFAERLASKLGIGSIEVKNSAQASFHPERAIYFDGTGIFDPSQVEELPTGFIISRAYLDFDIEYAKRELAIALDIALKPHDQGGHGFGEKFTAQSPLLLIIVARDSEQMNELKTEAQDTIRNLPKADHARVRLDGFI